MVYPALLSLMHTPRLPAVNWTDAPADLNGLVRFRERRNLVSACVPSHFKRSLHISHPYVTRPFPLICFEKIINTKCDNCLFMYFPSYSPYNEVSYSQSNMRMHHTMVTGDTQHATDTNNMMHLLENLSHLIKDCCNTWIGI